MNKLFATLLIALLAVAPAFADVASERDKTRKGAVIGGVAGAIVGGVLGNNRGSGNAKRGAAIGGVVGVATGAIVGAMMDKQERELRQIEGLDVTRVDEDELKVTVRCLPFDQHLPPDSRCVLTGKPAVVEAVFAKAY